MDKGDAGAKEITPNRELQLGRGERSNVAREREGRHFKTGDKSDQARPREAPQRKGGNGDGVWWSREKAERELRDYKAQETRKQAEARSIAKARWFLERDERDMRDLVRKPAKPRGSTSNG